MGLVESLISICVTMSNTPSSYNNLHLILSSLVRFSHTSKVAVVAVAFDRIAFHRNWMSWSYDYFES
jgi:hypothetical protein